MWGFLQRKWPSLRDSFQNNSITSYQLPSYVGVRMGMDVRTKIVGLIGYPLEHTLSPVMQNAAFRELDLDFIYLPFKVSPENLEQAMRGIRGLGIFGVNVTIPYKERVKEFLDELSDEAETVGAVNTIHRRDGGLRGDNTDGHGFLNSLREAGIDPRDKRIFLLGAGGAGRACAFMLAKSGAYRIILTDKVIVKAGSLIKDISCRFEVSCEVVSLDDTRIGNYVRATDILINATPVGMDREDELLIDPDWLHKDMVVYDLIYNPSETPLLKSAKEKGAMAINGLEMLLHQGALSFKLWTNLEAPIMVMRKALDEALRKECNL